MVRLLLVQDEAKVDAFIAKAEAAGKLNAAQAVKVKDSGPRTMRDSLKMSYWYVC